MNFRKLCDFLSKCGDAGKKRPCIECGAGHYNKFTCDSCWNSIKDHIHSCTDEHIVKYLQKDGCGIYLPNGQFINNGTLGEMIKNPDRELISTTHISKNPRNDFFTENIGEGTNLSDIKLTIDRLKMRKSELENSLKDHEVELEIVRTNLEKWNTILRSRTK